MRFRKGCEYVSNKRQLDRVSAETSSLTPSAQLIAVRLFRRSNAQGRAWPSQARLARETGLSTRTVSRAVAQLVAANVVRVLVPGDRRTHQATVYELVTLGTWSTGADWSQDAPCVSYGRDEWVTVPAREASPEARERHPSLPAAGDARDAHAVLVAALQQRRAAPAQGPAEWQDDAPVLEWGALETERPHGPLATHAQAVSAVRAIARLRTGSGAGSRQDVAPSSGPGVLLQRTFPDPGFSVVLPPPPRGSGPEIPPPRSDPHGHPRHTHPGPGSPHTRLCDDLAPAGLEGLSLATLARSRAVGALVWCSPLTGLDPERSAARTHHDRPFGGRTSPFACSGPVATVNPSPPTSRSTVDGDPLAHPRTQGDDATELHHLPIRS